MVHSSCEGFAIIFSDETKKDFKKLEQKTILKIFEKIKDLTSAKADNLDIKKLKTKTTLYRLRVGDYRVVYSIQKEKIIIYVVVVGHRKDVYGILERRFK
jgi:mRNA interferase RelE/StbE